MLQGSALSFVGLLGVGFRMHSVWGVGFEVTASPTLKSTQAPSSAYISCFAET